jgi:hypothetical protein
MSSMDAKDVVELPSENAHSLPERSPSMRALNAFMRGVSLLIMAIGCVSMLWIFSLTLFDLHKGGHLAPLFINQFLAIVGMPFSIFTAVGVVQFFRAFHGVILIKGLSFEFQGAAGPVVLWVGCFIAVAHTMRWLWVFPK